ARADTLNGLDIGSLGVLYGARSAIPTHLCFVFALHACYDRVASAASMHRAAAPGVVSSADPTGAGQSPPGVRTMLPAAPPGHAQAYFLRLPPLLPLLQATIPFVVQTPANREKNGQFFFYD